MRYLVLLFVLMPVAEMWLLITVGSQIGALPTIGLVLLTAVVGAGLLREQGFATLWKGRQKLQAGELPTTEIAEGLILAVSGALLLTPGFVTAHKSVGGDTYYEKHASYGLAKRWFSNRQGALTLTAKRRWKWRDD